MKKLLFCLLIVGCSTPQEIEDIKARRKQEEIAELSYHKDNRTGLCFVRNQTTHGYVVFTNVPCTPEVEKLIK